MPPTPFRSIRPWLVLACILAIYVYNVEVASHGLFRSASRRQHLLQLGESLGAGPKLRHSELSWNTATYKIPSFVSYLLSWVWKWHPIFPDNFKYGVWITEFFGYFW